MKNGKPDGYWINYYKNGKIKIEGNSDSPLTLGGTSAGAAVMGHHMIAGGSSGESPNRALVDMAMGLSIIPEIIVDQHFHNRNRMARLLSALSSHPERIGIGICVFNFPFS